MNFAFPRAVKRVVVSAPPECPVLSEEKPFYRSHYNDHIDIRSYKPLICVQNSLRSCFFDSLEFAIRLALKNSPLSKPHMPKEEFQLFCEEAIKSGKPLSDIVKTLFGDGYELNPQSNRPVYIFKLTTTHEIFFDVQAPDAAQKLSSDNDFNRIVNPRYDYWKSFQRDRVLDALGEYSGEEMGTSVICGSVENQKQRTQTARKLFSEIFGADLFEKRPWSPELKSRPTNAPPLQRAEFWLKWAEFDPTTYSQPHYFFSHFQEFSAVLSGDTAYINPQLLKLEPTPVITFQPQELSRATLAYPQRLSLQSPS